MYNNFRVSNKDKNSPGTLKSRSSLSNNPTKGCLKGSSLVKSNSMEQQVSPSNKENLRRVSFFGKTHVRHYKPAFAEEEEEATNVSNISTTKQPENISATKSSPKSAESSLHESFEIPIKDGHDSFETTETSFQIPIVEDSDLSFDEDEDYQHNSFHVVQSNAADFVSPTGSDLAAFQETLSNMVQGTPLAKFNTLNEKSSPVKSSPLSNSNDRNSPLVSFKDSLLDAEETSGSTLNSKSRRISSVSDDMELSFGSPGVRTRRQSKLEANVSSSRRSSTISSASLPEDMELTETFVSNKFSSYKSPKVSRRKSSLAPVDMDLTGNYDFQFQQPSSVQFESPESLNLTEQFKLSKSDMSDEEDRLNMEVEESSPTPAMEISRTPVKHKYKTIIPSKLSEMVEVADEVEKKAPVPPPRKHKSAPSTPASKEEQDDTIFIKSCERKSRFLEIPKMLAEESPLKEVENDFVPTSPRRSSRLSEKLELTPSRRLTQTPKELKQSSIKKHKSKVTTTPQKVEWLVDESINMASPGLPVQILKPLTAQDLVTLSGLEDDIILSDKQLLFPFIHDETDGASESEYFSKCIIEWEYLVAREQEFLESVERQIESSSELLKITIEHFASDKSATLTKSDKLDIQELPSNFLEMLNIAAAEACWTTKLELIGLQNQTMDPYFENIQYKSKQIDQFRNEWQKELNILNDKCNEIMAKHEQVQLEYDHVMDRASFFDLNNIKSLDEKEQLIKEVMLQIESTEKDTEELKQRQKSLEEEKKSLLKAIEEMKTETGTITRKLDELNLEKKNYLSREINKNYNLITKTSFWEIIGIVGNQYQFMYRRMFVVTFQKTDEKFICSEVKLVEEMNKKLVSLSEALNVWLENLEPEDVWYWIEKYYNIIIESYEWFRRYPGDIKFDKQSQCLFISVINKNQTIEWKFKLETVSVKGSAENDVISKGWMSQLLQMK